MSGPFRKRARRAFEWAGVVYLALVALSVVLLSRVGETWWVTAVGLYVPRAIALAPPVMLGLVLWRLGSRWGVALQGATAVLVLVPLMGLEVPAPRIRTAAGPHVRVLTYNINSAQGGVDNLAAEIDGYAPDVVFMQEIGKTAELERAMKERFATVLVSGQFLTASRYPILSENDPSMVAFGGKQHRARFVEVTLDTPLGPIAFYNVHPLSPREDFYRLRGHGLKREILSGHIFSGEAADAIVANAELRGLQVETFADAAAHETGPTVIGGDTNLPGLSLFLRQHLARFQDAFAKAGWGFGYTFPNDRRFAWMRIDRVLATDDLRFSAIRVGTQRTSDHRPVIADIQAR